MKQNSRDRILGKISDALRQNSTKATAIVNAGNKELFHAFDESLEVIFARELQRVDGKFIFCLNEDELLENLKEIRRHLVHNQSNEQTTSVLIS